jgi:Fe-S cluster assembly protein SufD
MTTTVPPRTPAERALTEAFARIGNGLPGSGWVARVSQEAMQWFETNGLPNRRVEEFKYTDLRERLKEAFGPALVTPGQAATASVIDAALGPLAAVEAARLVFVDGTFAAELSSTTTSDAVEMMPLAPLLQKAPTWLEGKFGADRLSTQNALTALNTAFMSDGLLLKIKPNSAAPKPVMIVNVRASAAPGTTALRNVIAVEAGASLELIEVFVSLPGAAPKGLSSTLTDVVVADGGTLTHVKCALDPAASHLSSWSVKIGANANYRAFQMTAGPDLARNDISVELGGRASKLDLSGAFLGRKSNHVDSTLIVDHKVPGCESRELFKGVLDDRARGVFQGKIIVRQGADKTDGKQMARALLLSEDAEFDSKPELEIYADDVACGHGATAAALDENLMFYCLSRGIPEQEARTLLIEAFIGEATDKIENEPLREALVELARQWLARGAA